VPRPACRPTANRLLLEKMAASSPLPPFSIDRGWSALVVCSWLAKMLVAHNCNCNITVMKQRVTTPIVHKHGSYCYCYWLRFSITHPLGVRHVALAAPRRFMRPMVTVDVQNWHAQDESNHPTTGAESTHRRYGCSVGNFWRRRRQTGLIVSHALKIVNV
jgi:hypothetical protein